MEEEIPSGTKITASILAFGISSKVSSVVILRKEVGQRNLIFP